MAAVTCDVIGEEVKPIMRGFHDLDCRACRGFGERMGRRDRPCGEQTGRRLRCRRCRGTGLL